jgi:hypothetical protein
MVRFNRTRKNAGRKLRLKVYKFFIQTEMNLYIIPYLVLKGDG